jgi:hypothetical protein
MANRELECCPFIGKTPSSTQLPVIMVVKSSCYSLAIPLDVR